MDEKGIIRHIQTFETLTIAVLGDIMLDRFVRGDAARISPEAPVPVVSYDHEQLMLGGAGNVASNLVSLGVHVSLFGNIGTDTRGETVLALAQEAGIDVQGIARTDLAPTTYKERIVARNQHIVRIDHERRDVVPTFTTGSFTFFLNQLDAYDAIVVSDYMKGVLTPSYIASLLAAAQEANIPVIVDTKPQHIRQYKGVTIITPNDKEVLESVGGTDPIVCAETLAEELQSSILLTRGEKGVHLITGGEHAPFSARVKEVVDVSGAGDTVCAVVASMIASGSGLKEAAYTGNVAGGIVVTKHGTASVSRSELIAALQKRLPSSVKMHTKQSLLELARIERADGARIVFTNGCFDILHRGHIEYLEEAKHQGDILIVAMNSDDSVRGLKGPTRPINTLESRMAVIAALSSVDAVVAFEEAAPTDIILAIQPDVYVKGGDYTMEMLLQDPTGQSVASYGGHIYLTSKLGGHSTSTVISKVIEAHRSQ